MTAGRELANESWLLLEQSNLDNIQIRNRGRELDAWAAKLRRKQSSWMASEKIGWVNCRRDTTGIQEEWRQLKETTEECSPVLLTLYLIINKIKYPMLITQLEDDVYCILLILLFLSKILALAPSEFTVCRVCPVWVFPCSAVTVVSRKGFDTSFCGSG